VKTETRHKETIAWQADGAPQTGVLLEIGASGSPIVDYSGNELGPIPARTAIASANAGDTVLLVFDGGDPTRPIVVGVVRDHFEKSQPQRLKIAAKEIVVEGTEEVSLRCGESSLTLRKDGKAVLKGREVLSRASRTNRIKGATVQLN
jgi:hypothetical protein